MTPTVVTIANGVIAALYSNASMPDFSEMVSLRSLATPTAYILAAPSGPCGGTVPKCGVCGQWLSKFKVALALLEKPPAVLCCDGSLRWFAAPRARPRGYTVPVDVPKYVPLGTVNRAPAVRQEKKKAREPLDRDKKRAEGGYNWSDDDPVGKKRQRLVAWLMAWPRCVPLGKAKLAASRKYRY